MQDVRTYVRTEFAYSITKLGLAKARPNNSLLYQDNVRRIPIDCLGTYVLLRGVRIHHACLKFNSSCVLSYMYM